MKSRPNLNGVALRLALLFFLSHFFISLDANSMYAGPAADTLTIMTSEFDCVADFTVPGLQLTGEDCPPVDAVQYTLLAGPGDTVVVSGNIADQEILNLNVGAYRLLRCAVDECGTELCAESCLLVVDETPPAAVCVSDYTVRIGAGDSSNEVFGSARITTDSIDSGSFDNCGTVTLEIRRNFWRNFDCDPSPNRWSPWGEFVDFYCCDAGRDDITVELRVTDASGLQSVCWLVVEVIDDLMPFCFAPEDVTFNCLERPAEFPTDVDQAYGEDFNVTSVLMNTIFGGASGTDNCAVDTIVERQPVIQLNECGWGTITRRFESWQLRPEGDANGNGAIDIEEVYRSVNPCVQILTITEGHEFSYYFRPDWSRSCTGGNSQQVPVAENGCDVVSVNISEPELLAVNGTECYQLAITHDVINWCIWDGAYAGFEIPRRTEDDGDLLSNGYTVEQAERPVIHLITANGPDDENCDGLLSEDENGADDADDLRYYLAIDRSHSGGGDSALPDEFYDNDPTTAAACLPEDGDGNRNFGRYRYVQVVRVNGPEYVALRVSSFGGPTPNAPDLAPGQFGDDDGNCAETVSIPFSFDLDCFTQNNMTFYVGGTVTAELDEFALDLDADGEISEAEFSADREVTDLIATPANNAYRYEEELPVIPTSAGANVFHALRVSFADDCGQVSTDIVTFDVVDVNGPAPICINGLTVTLEPQPDGSCAAAVEAMEMIATPGYDCTGQGPQMDADGNLLVTTCAVYLATEVEADPDFIPDPDHTTITVSEDDDPTTVVYVYCFDAEGNYDFCETYILVQTDGACTPVPDLVCPEATDQAGLSVGLMSTGGVLTAADTPFTLTDQSCYANFLNLEAGEHRLDITEFVPSVDGYYTFFPAADFAGNLSLYDREFTLHNPCSALLGAVDIETDLPLPAEVDLPDDYLGFYLQAGEPYYYVIANQGPDIYGSWEVYAYHQDGSGTLSNFSFPAARRINRPLTSADLDYVYFEQPRQWIVNPNGTLNNDLTRDQFFGGSQAELNAFITQIGYTGIPQATDDCGLLLVTLTDELTTNGDCGDVVITRTFATEPYDDFCDNPALTCEQTITLPKPALAAVQLPPFSGNLRCDQPFATDGDVGGPDDNPAAAETGFPLLLTLAGYQSLDQTVENLGAVYTDEERLLICEGTYKHRRWWSFANWCAPAENFTYSQFVSVEDLEGPIVTDLVDTIIVSTTPFSCVATFVVPDITVEDGNGCSSAESANFLITTLPEGAFFAGGALGQGDVISLPTGMMTLTRCAEDACGNETCVETLLIVEDQDPPVAVCREQIVAAIGGGDLANGVLGIARIFPPDVDDGSFDGCGEVTLEIRRNFWRNNDCDPSPNRWSPWGEFVDFYCCDVGEDGRMIELRVTDESGLQSICTTSVIIVDEINPFCFAPDDEAFPCNDYPQGFPEDIEQAYADDFNATSLLMYELFGNVTGTDNCALDTFVEMQPLIQFNDCGTGTVTRRFEAWQLRPEGDVNGNGAIDIDEAFRSENVCTQVITIEAAHDFMIDFPADAEVSCGTPDLPGVQVTAGSCDVLAVNVSEPVPLPATGDECYQLAVTHDVINWCVWDGVFAGFEIPRRTEEDGDVIATGFTVEPAERPILHLTTARGPDDENCDGILSFPENQPDNDNDLRFFLTVDRSHNGDEGDSALADELYDNVADTPAACIPADADGNRNYGRFRYVQVLRVNGAGDVTFAVADFGGPTPEAPELTPGQFAATDGDCSAEAVIPFSFLSACELLEDLDIPAGGSITAALDEFALDADMDGQISLAEFTEDQDVSNAIATDAAGNYLFTVDAPIIAPAQGANVYHALRVSFTDNCGNTGTEVITFDVVDRFISAPLCVAEYAVSLEPQADGNCGATLMAAQLLETPLYDCTGQGPEVDAEGNPRVHTYAVYPASEVDGNPDFIPDPEDESLELTEEAEGSLTVYVYGFDEAGNYARCQTTLLLVPSTACNRNLQGIVVTKEDAPVEDVEMQLTGSNAAEALTGPDGFYQFNFYLTGTENYLITPRKDTEHGNGVNTIDMIILRRHTLGIQLMTNPYQLIAADVNNDGMIDDDDFNLIRQLLLGNISTFPNNTSWRFVDAAYVFPEPTNPWAEPFPETISLTDVQEDVEDANFIGLKVGDLNGTAETWLRPAAASRERAVFHLYAEDMPVSKGETYTVPIRLRELERIAALQGTLQGEGVELLEVEYGLLRPEDLSLRHLLENYLTMSWLEVAGASANRRGGSEEPTLFTLVLRAQRDGYLRDMLRINSRYTLAEAYGRGALTAAAGPEVMDLALRFTETGSATDRFALEQNVPNPFRESTLITVQVPAGRHPNQLTNVTLTITDAAGRVLLQRTGDYPAGRHFLEVDRADLSGATGVLTYTVRAGKKTISRTMVVVD